MDNIKEWADKYCLENNITYDDLLKKALNLYKSYMDKEEDVYNYIISSEFSNAIEKMYRVINKSKTIWAINIVNNKDELSEYKSQSAGELNHFLLYDRCNILKVSYKGLTCAYALVSYEDEENEFGRYVFIHDLYFIDKKMAVYYKTIEQKMLQFARVHWSGYLDRIIKNMSKEDILARGYFVLWENTELSIDLTKYDLEAVKYSYKFIDKLEEDYILTSKLIPERFKSKDLKLTKIETEDGGYFMRINKNADIAYAEIYFNKSRLNEIEYVKRVHVSVLDLLSRLKFKELKIIVDDNQITILNELVRIDKLDKIYWIRKVANN